MENPKIEDWGNDGILIIGKSGEAMDNAEIIEAYTKMVNCLKRASNYMLIESEMQKDEEVRMEAKMITHEIFRSLIDAGVKF